MTKEYKKVKSSKYFNQPRPDATNVMHPLDSFDSFLLMVWSAWDDFIEQANGKYGKRDGNIWVTIKPIEETLRDTWDTEHRKFWVERYIDEIGFMLWNRVFNVEYNTGVADKALAKFEDCWQ